jgi:type I restriction enzyme, S subunit
MKSTVVSSSSVISNEFRLDSRSYISGSIALNMRLDKLSIRKESLQNLTLNGTRGLIEISRFMPRQWVNEPDDGVPFLSGVDILRADLSNVDLISKMIIQRHPELLLKKGWILITRSGSAGTIGHVVYCRSDMSDMAASENILRVIPDPNKILPGYLYAFLISQPGTSLIAAGIYGSTTKHLSAQHIAQLPIPRLGNIETTSHDLCVQAAKSRTEANLALKEAGSLINGYFQFPEKLPFSRKQDARDFPTTAVSSIRLQSRMDASFYNISALEGDRLIKSIIATERLSNLVEINITENFRGDFAYAKYGTPLLTKSDMLRLYYAPTRFFSKDVFPQDEKWAVEEGDLLLTQDNLKPESSCLGLWADKRFNGSYPAPGILHLKVFSGKISSGYLYAYFFLTDLGYQQLVRTIVRSSKPHLSLSYILAMPIPRATSSIENDVDLLIRKSGHLRAEAQEKEDAARRLIEQALQYEKLL